MLWLAGALFLFLRWIAKKFRSKWIWWLPFSLLLLAVFALAFAPIPFTDLSVAGLVAWLVGWAFNLVGSAFGVSGSVIAGVALFVVLAAGLVDLFKDRKADGWATTMVYSAPVLALLAAGPIAPQILEFVQTISGVGPTVVTTIAS